MTKALEKNFSKLHYENVELKKQIEGYKKATDEMVIEKYLDKLIDNHDCSHFEESCREVCFTSDNDEVVREIKYCVICEESDQNYKRFLFATMSPRKIPTDD